MPSRNIPDLKRQVRQRCGYGCVICGLPLYEYDHIVGWAETQQHVAEDLTLLCDRHHKEKTNGLMTVDQVRVHDAKPFNIVNGVTSLYGLHFGGEDELSFVIGGNTFTSAGGMAPIVVDNSPVLAFGRDGSQVALFFALLDELNRPQLLIDANELSFRTDTWDATLQRQLLTLRSAPGEVVLRIRFVPPTTVVIERARLLCNGVEIEVDDDSIRLNGGRIKLQESWWNNAAVGFTVGFCPQFRPPTPFLQFDVNRYRQPEPAREEAPTPDEV